MPISDSGRAGQWGSNKPNRFPLLLGRQIYNMFSLTTESRNPVEDLVAYGTAGAIMSKPVDGLDLEELFLSRVVEGGLVVYDADLPARRIVPFSYVKDARTWHKYIPNAKGGIEIAMVREDDMDTVYSKGGTLEYRLDEGGEFWIPRMLDKTLKPCDDKLPDDFADPVPAKKIRVFPGGRGVAYWGQNALHRMEELAETMRRVMSGPNLLPIISGNVGGPAEVDAAFNTAKRVIVFPGDIKIDRVISTAIIQQLVSEDGIATSRWYRALKVVEPDSPGRPVAAHTAMRMTPMLKYIQRAQDFVKAVVSALGGEVTFAAINVLTVDERQKLYDLYKQMVSVGDMTPDEFEARLKTLKGV